MSNQLDNDMMQILSDSDPKMMKTINSNIAEINSIERKSINDLSM